MFDSKMEDEADDSVLAEIIRMCEQHMASPFKKEESPIAPESEEIPGEVGLEAAPNDDLSDEELDELLKFSERG